MIAATPPLLVIGASWNACGFKKSLSSRAPSLILWEYLLTIKKIKKLIKAKIDKKLVIKELQKRDQRDMERSTAPLKIAKDAIVIDTSDLTIEEVNSIVQREIAKVIKLKE